jgi:hypothetical protein
MAKFIEDKIYDATKISGNPKNFYSEENPRGPYESTHRPDSGSRPQAEYIEGASNKKNLKMWAERASANSGPKIAPGLDGKGGSRREDDR